MIAAPSDTDEVFAMALPPTKSSVIGIGQHREDKIRTPCNLINYLLRSSSIEVIDDDVCTSRCEKVRVPINTDEITQVANRSGTHVRPSPPPAPVTTTVWPLKESDMLVEDSWAEPPLTLK